MKESMKMMNVAERTSTDRSSIKRASPAAIDWIALGFSLLWIFGIGSFLGVVLGTWSVVRSRRAGLKTPTVALVAITIGVVSLALALLSGGLVVGMESMNPGDASGSAPSE